MTGWNSVDLMDVESGNGNALRVALEMFGISTPAASAPIHCAV